MQQLPNALSLLVAFVFCFTVGANEPKQNQRLNFDELPVLKQSPALSYSAILESTVVSISKSNGAVRTMDLNKEDPIWLSQPPLELASNYLAETTDGTSLFLVGSEHVLKVSFEQSGSLQKESLPDLPESLENPTALVDTGKLYIAGLSKSQTNLFLSLDLSTTGANWTALPNLPGPNRKGGRLSKAIESIYYVGGYNLDGTALPTVYYHPLYGWRNKSVPPTFSFSPTHVPIGESHSLYLLEEGSGSSLYLYHAIGDSWAKVESFPELAYESSKLTGRENETVLLSNDRSVTLSFGNPETNYGWWDHLAVAGYFAIMIYIGFYFTKQSKTSKSFFRGSNNIPWWATGMSLFATGASALSLLSMPGKSYSTNWTFFSISVFSVLCLPLSMYLLAPLVRKLNFATAFEYLEHRFGLSVRMFGSAIFVMQQILGRMGPVMLLPAIAMNAITGVDVKTCIIAMGVVTTLYTFLGGLAAVIWTDTIQGFVMIVAVLGCLVLVYLKIDMPTSEMMGVLTEGDKLHMMNWSTNFTQDNVMTMFFGIMAITLFGISDQNYVQRVQCTPTLKDAKKAIATQMAVAVPINVLLFGLGTALFLFYRSNPTDLNPVMKTDGIFPFFAAQQLPPGVSGLVVAALLAATMSTISSAICSVSNLGVDDFYRRFNKGTSDRQAVIMGRILTLVVGGLGIAAALFLADFKTPSIWDLANRLITFITSATLGIFALGLFSRKANEIGVIAGIIAGMASTYYLKNYTAMSYWFYPLTGSAVTYAVGVAVSLLTGGNQKPIQGLTLHTINQPRKGTDKSAQPLDSTQCQS